jgi:hypothetical protein
VCAGAPVEIHTPMPASCPRSRPGVLEKGGNSSANADADTDIILITRDTRPRQSPAAFLGLHAAGWLAMGCVACVALLNSPILFSFQHTSNGMLGDW